MAMKHATEYIRGLRYKLKSMGIPVDECAYIYSDNNSVLVNLGRPHLQLKKKSNSVAYHHVCDGSALDEWITAYINTHENIANLMTKNLPSGAKRTKFCKMLLHFLLPSIEAGKEDDYHTAAATAVKVIPGQCFKALVGAMTVWEEQDTANA